jgi:VanZ family protein
MNRRSVLWWCLAASWAAKIFWLATETFSSERSGSHLKMLFALFNLDVSPEVFRTIHLALRKSAHLLEYCLLGALVFRALGATRANMTRLQLSALSILISAAYAFSDEFHQMFVNGRGPSVVDWMIDTIGAALGVLLLSIGPLALRPHHDKLKRPGAFASSQP